MPRARETKARRGCKSARLLLSIQSAAASSFHLIDVRPRCDLIHAAPDLVGVLGEEFDVKRGAEAVLRQAHGLARLCPNFMVEVTRKFWDAFEVPDRTQRALLGWKRGDDSRGLLIQRLQIRNLAGQGLVIRMKLIDAVRQFKDARPVASRARGDFSKARTDDSQL